MVATLDTLWFFRFLCPLVCRIYVKISKPTRSDWFVFLLIVLSTILIILPELIYVKDIYPANYRANTMFKLVFQAFIMLSLVSGYTIVRFAGIFRSITSAIWLFIAMWLCGLVALYPYLATSYYGNLRVSWT